MMSTTTNDDDVAAIDRVLTQQRKLIVITFICRSRRKPTTAKTSSSNNQLTSPITKYYNLLNYHRRLALKVCSFTRHCSSEDFQHNSAPLYSLAYSMVSLEFQFFFSFLLAFLFIIISSSSSFFVLLEIFLGRPRLSHLNSFHIYHSFLTSLRSTMLDADTTVEYFRTFEGWNSMRKKIQPAAGAAQQIRSSSSSSV